MLQIRAYLSESGIHGMGLFAAEDIEEGEVVWRFTPGIDQAIGVTRLTHICREMNDTSLNTLCNYIYKKNNRYFLLGDNARFINHSGEAANIAFTDEHTEVALRRISAGEEILEDYNASYDLDDPFFFEIRNICVERLLMLPSKERLRLVKGQNVPG